MELFVVYYNFGWGHYSIPIAIFSKEELAEEYCGNDMDLTWTELEVDVESNE